MKLLNGTDLKGFIKERQAKQVRGLIQSQNILPKLAIIQLIDNPVIDTYVRLKQNYGSDIQVDVELHKIPQAEAEELIARLNSDESIHGIIIQLPIENPDETNKLLNLVDIDKDVDGLRDDAQFVAATPTAIMWLLDGYNISLRGKKIVIVGLGKLVGLPLSKELKSQGYDVTTVERETENADDEIKSADVLISATGVPGRIKSDLLKNGVVAVDAGVAMASGKTVGDFSEDVYSRDDLTLTPKRGGVGPVTVAALFENVIRSAQLSAKN